jgi:hypothetical protein
MGILINRRIAEELREYLMSDVQVKQVLKRLWSSLM